MDSLTETPTWSGVAPLLTWIKILEVVAVVLVLVAVLTLVAGWVRHLSWWVRLSAIVPLATSIGAAVAVHALHGTYVFWATVSNVCPGHCPPGTFSHAQYVADAAHMAAVFVWVGLIVMGIWLLVDFIGFWLLRPPKQRQQSSSLAAELWRHFTAVCHFLG